MGKPAVAAPHREVVAPNSHIMRPSGPTDAAGCIGQQAPEIIAPYFCVIPWFGDILNPRDKDPGGTAVATDDLCLVGDGLDDLICLFFAVIARCPVFGKDEPVRHV